MLEAFFQRRWLPAAVIALLAGVCVFVLPYAVAPRPAYSQSYVVGFSNRIAIAAILLISLAVVALTVRRRIVAPTARPSTQERLRWPLPLLAACAVLLWIGALSLLCLKETARVAEERYFLTQMEKVAFMHRALYTQVEFAYGPLLFYPTLWIAHLFHGLQALDRAYYLTLIVHQVLGVAMLWFIVNRLPLTRSVRLATFLALVIYGLNPWMGLNYTLVRFLAAPFCLAVLADLKSLLPLSIAAFCAPVLVFALSPETGITLTIGAVVLCTARAFLNDRRLLLASAASIAGFAAALITAPAGLLSGLLHFSNGFHQTVLLPSPAMLLTLAAAVWCAPIAVARAFTSRSAAFPLLAGLYASSLATLPVTFATTDSMHLLSNALGLLLLAAAYVSGNRPLERAWLVASPAVFALFFVQCLLASWYGFVPYLPCADPGHTFAGLAGRISPRLSRAALHVEGRGCPAPISPGALPASAAQDGFTILSGGDSHLLQVLVRQPGYRPVSFANQVNVWNPDAQRILIGDMRQAHWLLAPPYPAPRPVSPDLDTPLDLHFHRPQRAQIAADDLIADELHASWIPTAKLTPNLWLYQRAR